MTRRPDPVSDAAREVALSRPLCVDDVREEGLETAITADPAECEAVAKEVGLPSVAAPAAGFRIFRRPGGRLHVEGEVSARITQICVVSLEPFESEVAQPIEIDFAPPPPAVGDLGLRAKHVPPVSRRRRTDAAPPPPAPAADVHEDDPPDPIVDGKIDLGAVAVEFLTLGLDFYPRKPGVRFTDTAVGTPDAPQATAFAVLERLKDRS